jgi:hypothetical protein
VPPSSITTAPADTFTDDRSPHQEIETCPAARSIRAPTRSSGASPHPGSTARKLPASHFPKKSDRRIMSFSVRATSCNIALPASFPCPR